MSTNTITDTIPIQNDERPIEAQGLRWIHVKTILISGVGFMTDAYDLFIIGIITPMIAEVYYNGVMDPTGEGLVKGSAAWGTLIGQLFFGFLADKIGRKSLYALVLLMITLGTLASAMAGPTQAVSVLGMLGLWRVFLGIGIGGDYPLSGVMTSEFASTRVRGMMIAAVFAMQGIGILLASLVSVIVVAMLKSGISDPSTKILYLDWAWRLCIAIGAIPGLVGVYFRLKVPESPRYTANVHGNADKARADLAQIAGEGEKEKDVEEANNPDAILLATDAPSEDDDTTNKKVDTFRSHFSQWKNLKVLLGTAVTWFALDVGFYGTNLNTPTILAVIGFGGGDPGFDRIWNVCLGNLAIAFLGLVPGYWFTVYFIEKWGRLPIQYMGFAFLTVLFIILGAFFDWLKTQSVPLFVVIYTLIQFFNNFGPNATTFVLAGEVFPTRFRGSAHGISAASGKAGAILAAHGFSIMKDLGGEKGSGAFIPQLLFVFAGFMAVGGLFTVFVPETKGKTLEELCGEEEL